MSSSTDPSIALTPLCELQPSKQTPSSSHHPPNPFVPHHNLNIPPPKIALPDNATPLQAATAHRDTYAAAAADAMATLHRMFDPKIHIFRGFVNEHDALALEIQTWVSLKEFRKADKKVKRLEKREVVWEKKMVAREEAWKGEINESEYALERFSPQIYISRLYPLTTRRNADSRNS